MGTALRPLPGGRGFETPLTRGCRNASMPLVSKSKYVAGLQCRKLFWTYYNDKTKIPPVDAATQAVFDQGHEVGDLAKSLFPRGIEIEGDPWDFQGLMARTRMVMKKRAPIYEAAFGSGGAFARADILVPVDAEAWDIVEVKSSTEVKPVHIDDLALQRFAAEGAGLKIGKCFLMRVDNTYVRKGAVEAEKLFALEDVTSRVAEELPNVGKNLAGLLAVLGQRGSPDIKIGPHCDDPYTCPLHDACWAFLPEDNPLKVSGFNKEEAFRLIHGGIMKISEMPLYEGAAVHLKKSKVRDAFIPFKIGEKQNIQIEAARSGLPFVKPGDIKEFLKKLSYPRYFLDFETFQSAVPLLNDTRPYQQVPFQFSLHVVAQAGAVAEHFSYLAEGKTDPATGEPADPRPEFIALLRDRLGEEGPVICYNAAFERGIMDATVDVLPEHKNWWKKTEKRFVDLLVPFRSFAYYHPGQIGSASLKAVYPALTGGPGYQGLEICDGGQAAWEYRRVTYGRVEPEDRARVLKQLEEYCGLDTEAMIRIVAVLEALELPAEEHRKKKKNR